MRRLLSRLPIGLLATVASLAATAPTASATTCSGTDLEPTAANVAVVESATLCLLNEQRAAAGLSALRRQPALDGPAHDYSVAMVAGRFFGHVSPSGQTMDVRLDAYTTPATTWETGENLGWGDRGMATAATIVDAWMHSAAHRANILEPGFTEVGIGVVMGTPVSSEPDAATYTTEFGARTFESAADDVIVVPQTASAAARAIARATAARIAAQRRTLCSRTAVRRLKGARRKARVARCVVLARRAAAAARV